MSDPRKLRPEAMDTEQEQRPGAESNAEEEDLYAQLAQKERDLILAAELGKALLDSNQDLQSRYDQTVEEYTHRVEELQQEKYDLHLQLEKMETEYQNTIKDLQDDLASLRKQVRANTELQVSERERSRSLREAQQNSDFLMEQIKRATIREEELMEEIEQLRSRNESNTARIQDLTDHISMLRDQVEYLSERLRETNKRLLEIQGEKEVLIATLETTQENLQVLEVRLSEQDVKIHRQTGEIEELLEVNSDLHQQINQRQFRGAFLNSRDPHVVKNESGNTGIRSCPDQEKNKSNKFISYSFSNQTSQAHPEQHVPDQTSTAQESQLSFGCGVEPTGDKSLISELVLGDGDSSRTASPLPGHFPLCRHGRKICDCRACFLNEGSRKRHHANISCGVEDDEVNDNAPKQTLYSEVCLFDSPVHSSLSSLDAKRNLMSRQASASYDCSHSLHSDGYHHLSSAESLSKEYTESLTGACAVLPETEPRSSLESCQKHYQSFQDYQNHTTSGEFSEHFEESFLIGKETNEKSLLSELSSCAQDFYTRRPEFSEQSLFNELSSQLYEDRNGTGSESSSNSNCMLGVFDFSSNDAQDVDRNSNESLNRSMEMKSRIETDMSYVSDWYYMTPVTSEMLEDDDFECDDDDFLIGNMAGTTLSISDSKHGLRYHYHGYIPGGNMADLESCDQAEAEVPHSHESNRQVGHEEGNLSEVCRQIQELVIKCRDKEGTGTSRNQSAAGGDGCEFTGDSLISLVAELRIYIDKLTRQEDVQSCHISTTVTEDSTPLESLCSPLNEQDRNIAESEAPPPSEARIDQVQPQGENKRIIRKSKSSSSLL